METVFNPDFLLGKKDAFIMDQLDLFAKLCEKLRSNNKCASVEVFKTLSEVIFIPELPEIEKLFTMLKEVVFAQQSMLLSCEESYNSSMYSTPQIHHRSLPPIEVDRATCIAKSKRLQDTISEHETACLTIQRTQTKIINLYKALSEKLTPDKGWQLYEAKLVLNEAVLRERTFRDSIESLSEQLTTISEKFIHDRIMRGMKALKEVCLLKNLSMEVKNKLKTVDVVKMTTEIIEKCSFMYFYPDFKTYPMNTKTPCHMYSELSGKGPMREIYNNAFDDNMRDEMEMENTYVTGMENIKAEYAGQLSMKKGKKIKQKIVSSDGQMAFGWTRWFKGAPKSYGFYPVTATTS